MLKTLGISFFALLVRCGRFLVIRCITVYFDVIHPKTRRSDLRRIAFLREIALLFRLSAAVAGTFQIFSPTAYHNTPPIHKHQSRLQRPERQRVAYEVA